MPSPNGMAVASPEIALAPASAVVSPAVRIAPNIPVTGASSAGSRSKATTSAPRRYTSNACRPPPQPRSSTRSPGRTGNRRKSTVSTRPVLSCLSLRGGQPFHRGQVLPDGGMGHRGPGEPLADPAQGPVRQRVPLGGGVVQPAQHGREFLVLARRDQDGGVAGDFGQRPGPARHQRGAGGPVIHRG